MEAVTCTVWADRPMLVSLNLRERWWQYMLVHVLAIHACACITAVCPAMGRYNCNGAGSNAVFCNFLPPLTSKLVLLSQTVIVRSIYMGSTKLN